MDYNRRLRIKVKRSMGHNPFAPNCIFAEPQELHHDKAVCERCAEMARRFRI